jgi:hypothetical protein
MLKQSLSKVLVLVLLIHLSVVFSGCYGKFALTKKLYEFNGTIADPVAKSLVNAGLVIFVYWVSGLGDWAVFNVVEFWTGKNPIDQEVIKIKRADNGDLEAVQTLRRTSWGFEGTIDYYQQNRLVKRLEFQKGYGSPEVMGRLVLVNGATEFYRTSVNKTGQVILEHRDGGGTLDSEWVSTEGVTQLREHVSQILPGSGLHLAME